MDKIQNRLIYLAEKFSVFENNDIIEKLNGYNIIDKYQITDSEYYKIIEKCKTF
jgi:Mor family transcriptional regulator